MRASETEHREVLVAEDRDDERGALARALRAAGFFVRAVQGGTAALAAIRAGSSAKPSWSPDLIIADESSGLELVKAVRAAGLITPAIVLSACNALALQPEVMRLCSAFVLEKTLDVGAVVKAASLLV